MVRTFRASMVRTIRYMESQLWICGHVVGLGVKGLEDNSGREWSVCKIEEGGLAFPLARYCNCLV